MTLDAVDNLTTEEADRLSNIETDPIDEEATVAASPASRRPAKTRSSQATTDDEAPFGMVKTNPTVSTSGEDADAELFGTIWPLTSSVRLDTTVDRQQLRLQCAPWVSWAMKTLDSLTQSLIESLTKLLQQPEEDALESLKVCAPVLIEQLQQVLLRAVDRRDVEVRIWTVIEDWLQLHPQPETAENDLIEALRTYVIMNAMPPKRPQAWCS